MLEPALLPPLSGRTNPAGERFSGHESFVCRYGWLPKYYELLTEDPGSADDDEMVGVALGIGRNMVKSIRFWSHGFGLSHQLEPTPFARWLLDKQSGIDPYLEDLGSLWLLHWRLCATGQLAAWEVAFFETPESQILRKLFLQRVEKRALEMNRKLSPSTLRQHADIFVSTYASTQEAEGFANEESLGCPLQELGLLRVSTANPKEELLEFSRGSRQNLDGLTFARILLDYLELRVPHDGTVLFRTLLTDFASPGLVLRLDENSLWQLLLKAEASFGDLFQVSESADRRALLLKVSPQEGKKNINYV